MNEIEKNLLAWYQECGRELPWRGTRDPYKILVSEIMLQQTQVSRVILFFEKWLIQFPDWENLAKTNNAEIIHAWAGLGYNRRGLMLRDIAREIVKNGVPKSRDEWLKLKGIGPYTSAALTVFSLHKKAAPVDTNIRRVIGRIFLRKHYPDLKNDAGIEKIIFDNLMDSEQFYDIPQAIFDLATMHCVKNPDCAACPMKNHCKSAQDFISGKVEPPKRMTKKVNERIHRDKKHPDRIYRGRILMLARNSEFGINIHEIGPKIDKTFNTKLDKIWVEKMINRLEKDKLITKKDDIIYISED